MVSWYFLGSRYRARFLRKHTNVLEAFAVATKEKHSDPQNLLRLHLGSFGGGLRLLLQHCFRPPFLGIEIWMASVRRKRQFLGFCAWVWTNSRLGTYCGNAYLCTGKRLYPRQAKRQADCQASKEIQIQAKPSKTLPAGIAYPEMVDPCS